MPARKLEKLRTAADNYEVDMLDFVDRCFDAIADGLAPLLWHGDIDAARAAFDRAPVKASIVTRAERLRRDLGSYTNADNNHLQRMQGTMELQINEVRDMIAAVAQTVAEQHTEMRAGFAGQQVQEMGGHREPNG